MSDTTEPRPLTPERIAELLSQGVVLATVELLEQMEHEATPPVTLRSERQPDGTWKLLVTRYEPHLDLLG